MKFSYFSFLGLFLLGFTNRSIGQANIQTLGQSPVFASEAAFLNPSYLKNIHKFQLNIVPFMGINVGVSNNFVSVGTMIDISEESGDEMNFAPFHAVLDNLKKHNSIELQTDLTLLNANFKIGKGDKAFHAGLSVRHHIYSNQTINGDFFRLLINGNKQFAGQAVDLKPEISAISYTDIGFALSRTIKLGELKITPAARLRYLLGTGAAYTDQTKLELYTEANGEYIELNGKVNGYAGGVLDFGSIINDDDDDGSDDFEIKDAFKSMGRGFGLDLGVTVEYKNISLSLASVDNGVINFNADHGWHITSQNTSVKWEGFEFQTGDNGIDISDDFAPFDSLDIKADNKAFSTTIGSKIVFNGNYGLIQKQDKKGNPYYMNNLGVSYIQGFKNRYSASTSPRLAIYYQLNLGNRFSTGINYNMQGGAGDIGFNLGVSAIGLNLGLGSNSLMAAINQDASKQGDFFFLLGFAF